jgi:hypothetical protein
VTRFGDDCPGCIDVELFGGVKNHTEAVSLSVCAHREPGELFGVARIIREVESLAVDTCAILDRSMLDTVPELTCLDMGVIELGADWPEWPPLSSAYSKEARGYPMIIRPIGEGAAPYSPGANFTFSASGGSDVGSFSTVDRSPIPIRLTQPTTTSEGKFPSVRQDEPLAVGWEGGDDVESVGVILTGIWKSNGTDMDLGCRAKNDGSFVIPTDALAKLAWGQATALAVVASRSVPAGAPGLDGGRWLIVASSALYVHYDPGAVPPPPTGTMAAGHVGKPCTSDDECGGGTCQTSWYFPGGYCTLVNCTSDDQCSSDSWCREAPPAAPVVSFCAKKCSTDSECRENEDYVCVGSAGRQGCVLGIN